VWSGQYLVFAVLGASPAGGGKLKVKNQNAKLWSRFAGLILK